MALVIADVVAQNVIYTSAFGVLSYMQMRVYVGDGDISYATMHMYAYKPRRCGARRPTYAYHEAVVDQFVCDYV